VDTGNETTTLLAPKLMADVRESSSSSSPSVQSVAERPCGTCTACCTWLPIPAGHVGPNDKPAGVACPHLTCTGCREYENRPTICRRFECAFLKARTWPVQWRPDRSGLLCLSEPLSPGVWGAAVYELVPGRLDSTVGRAILEQLLAQSSFVVLITRDGRRILRQGLRVDTKEHIPRPHFAHDQRATESSPRGYSRPAP